MSRNKTPTIPLRKVRLKMEGRKCKVENLYYMNLHNVNINWEHKIVRWVAQLLTKPIYPFQKKIEMPIKVLFKIAAINISNPSQ